jgi:hypothetical protein
LIEGVVECSGNKVSPGRECKFRDQIPREGWGDHVVLLAGF